MERRGGVGAGHGWDGAEQCWVCKDGGENTDTHMHKTMRTTLRTLLAMYCMYSSSQMYILPPVQSQTCPLPSFPELTLACSPPSSPTTGS